MLLSTILVSTLVAGVIGCADHSENFDINAPLIKRAEGTNWAYEASYNWGTLQEDYALCQTGAKQSPIPLMVSQGLSLNHLPRFEYPKSIRGNYFNWGYGPAFTVARSNAAVWTSNPRMIFDNQTYYLAGWHIHAPADHTVQGDRSKAEMHFVHVNSRGQNAAVVAMRIDPGTESSAFFNQLPKAPSFKDTTTQSALSMDLTLALNEVNNLNEFWTYQGSLTSPPCTEGIRFFVARTLLFTSVSQMQSLLSVSKFSARAEQEVWLHQINV